MSRQYQRTKTMVMVAMFMALDVVITRFIAIQTPITRIGFGFVPISLCSMLFGPWVGAGSAFLSDFLGVLINSRGMAYFPGYGLSAALYGMSYGLFLYRKPKTWSRIIPCVVLGEALVGIGLGTLWSLMFTGKAPLVILASRIPQSLLMAPTKIIIVKLAWEYVGKQIENHFSYALHG